MGEGAVSCGEWLDRRRKEPNRILPEMAWVLGYLSAADRFNVEAKTNFLHGVHADGIDHWIDNYCTANPIDNIEEATNKLVDQLIARAINSN